MNLDKYLENIQTSSSSGMSFRVDSPQRKKKPLRKYGVSEQDKTIRRVMVDFDKTIHGYEDGWNDGKITGSLIEGAKEAIETLRNKGYEVVIFTTRASESENPDRKSLSDLEKWLRSKGIYFDLITADKIGADFYIDDKAIRFEGNWNDVLEKVEEVEGSMVEL